MTSSRFPFIQSLRFIVQGLYGKIAPIASRDRARTPLLVLVICRFQRMAARLERLAERWRAGKLHKPRPPRAGPKVPSGHGWLLGLVQETAQYCYVTEGRWSEMEWPSSESMIDAYDVANG